MKKKKLISVAVMIVTMVVNLATVYAGTSAAEQALTVSDIEEAMKALHIETLEAAPGIEMEIVRNATADGVIAIARDYDELLNALAADNIDGVYLVNDIHLEDALRINRNFSFESLFDDVKIFSAPEKRHIIVTAAGITLNLGNVILDGGFDNSTHVGLETGGGVIATDTLTVDGGTIQNCRIDTQGGSALRLMSDRASTGNEFKVYNCNILNNYANAHGAVYHNRPLTIENCKIYNSTCGGGGVNGSAIESQHSLYMKSCELRGNRNSSTISFLSVMNHQLELEIHDTIFVENNTQDLASLYYASTIYFEQRYFTRMVFENVVFERNNTYYNTVGV